MQLKPRKVYADRWKLTRGKSRPLAETTYRVYLGEEVAKPDFPLNGRPAFIKVARYSDDPDETEILHRRKALEQQCKILALEHFMLPEPLDFSYISNVHTPAISGTPLQDREPLLVYAHTPGETLREIVSGSKKSRRQSQRVQTFEVLDALEIIEKICDCLNYLHEQNYGHAAVNPNHFLFHKGSLRILGLSKIGNIDPDTGLLILPEIPYLPSWEGSFLPKDALVLRRFGLGTEYYSLVMLFLYLVTGIAPSQSLTAAEEQLAKLHICQPLRDLLNGWLADWQRPYGGDVDRRNLAQIISVRQAQRKFEKQQTLADAKVGVFIDFENTNISMKGFRRGEGPLVLDFEALAAAYQEDGPIYRFITVPEHSLIGFTRQAFDDLERAGWDVSVIGSNKKNKGMEEADDARLIQAATRFMEQTPESKHLVIVANDRDYFSLIKTARFRKMAVTVVLSNSPLVRHKGVSPDYLNKIRDLQVDIHILSSYPYIFADETRMTFREAGVHRRLPAAYGNEYKSLLWAFHRALGRVAMLEWLAEARKKLSVKTVLDVFRPLRYFDTNYHPFLVWQLCRTKDLSRTIRSLQRSYDLLSRFDPTNQNLLNTVFKYASKDRQLRDLLCRSPENVALHWDFLKGHLRKKDIALVEYFTQPYPLDPKLCESIKKDPQAFLEIAKGFSNRHFSRLLATHGLIAWDAIQEHGDAAILALREFGSDGLVRLSGQDGEQFKGALEDQTTLALLKKWYHQMGNLEVAQLFTTYPELRERVIKAGTEGGMAILKIFQDERDLAAVDEVQQLASTTSYRLVDTYRTWRHLRKAGVHVNDLIKHVEKVCGTNPEIFHSDLKPSTYTQLCLAIDKASTDRKIEPLLDILQSIRPEAALLAYNRFGTELFTLIESTDPFVVNWLHLFPDLFPVLNRYGRNAYDLIKKFNDDACKALLELQGHDLTPLLTNEQGITILEAWHAAKGDLRALSFFVHEPILLEWVGGMKNLSDNIVTDKVQAGLELLSLYDVDSDLSRLHTTMQLAFTLRTPLSDTHAVLHGMGIPVETSKAILLRQGERIFSLPTTEARLQAANAFRQANEDGYESDLANLFDNLGQTALLAYNQFGISALRLSRDISPDAIKILWQFPSCLEGLERYGKAAYEFISNYGKGAVESLNQFSGYDLANVLGEVARSAIQAWYQAKHDLELVGLLAEQWGLMDLIEKYGLRPAEAWLQLRETLGPGGFQHFLQLAQLLANPAYELDVLLPLVPRMQPESLQIAVQRYYDEIAQYSDVSKRARVVRLLTEKLRDDFPRNADRYVALMGKFNRSKLLEAIENGGGPALDLLEQLKPKAQNSALTILMHYKNPYQAEAYASNWLRYLNGLGKQSENTQTKLIQASGRQQITKVIEAWNRYGEAALDEIIRKGDLGLFFKMSHRRRN